jgi:hypothetical protein
MLLLPPVLDPVYGTDYAVDETRNRKFYRTVVIYHHQKARWSMMNHNTWPDQQVTNIMMAT